MKPGIRLPASAAILSLLLSGCVGSGSGVAPQGETPGGAPASPHRIVPAADGLDITASGGRQIGFGRQQVGVLETVGRITGSAPVAVPCPPVGRAAYRVDDDLVLVFRGGAFVGWQGGSGQATDGGRAGLTCS